MPQFYISPEQIDGLKAVLTGEEAHHVRNVSRMREGDSIQLFDGRGTAYRGAIASLNSRAVEVRVAQTFREKPHAGFRAVLVQSLIAKDPMDDVIQKATELGIDVIVPVIAKRSQLRPDAKRGQEKVDHWKKTALAACKQCERLTLPDIHPLMELSRWIEALPLGTRAVYADVSEKSTSLETVIGESAPKEGDITVVIGPEGDFCDAERALFRAKKVRPVTLGGSVLRSETAALFAVSLMRSARGI